MIHCNNVDIDISESEGGMGILLTKDRDSMHILLRTPELFKLLDELCEKSGYKQELIESVVTSLEGVDRYEPEYESGYAGDRYCPGEDPCGVMNPDAKGDWVKLSEVEEFIKDC